MYLRSRTRRKNGKHHRYFSVVESRRTPNGKTVQRQVLHLGVINDSQEKQWLKALTAFDEPSSKETSITLFPDDRPISKDAINGISLKLSEMELKRARSYGDCWLGCWLWSELGLDRFWHDRLCSLRGDVPWERVLQLLVVNRLIAPGSEFKLHRHWYFQSAMDELLNVTDEIAAKDRLYRCLDKILPYKNEVFQFLRTRWEDLFSADFEVLLYDLTSTYFEGLCESIPKAKHGYSRDGRSDCKQVVIALVVTTDGLPLAYEVMPGNTSDRATLPDFLTFIEKKYGKSKRTWIMDRGIPSEEILSTMRHENIGYLVGTPRGLLSKLESSFLDQPWDAIHEELAVKVNRKDGETYVLARSFSRRMKEQAIRRNKLRRYFKNLRSLKRGIAKGSVTRDQLLQRLGAYKSDAGRAACLVAITIPPNDDLSRFDYALKVAEFKEAASRDGQYLLRTTLSAADPKVIWKLYIQLTQIEAAFKSLKSDLEIRPIFHSTEQRVEAHIFVAFLAYALSVSLRKRMENLAPGLTTKAVFECLSGIKMLDVCIPTTDGRLIILPRYTSPEQDQALILNQLKLQLPDQPPPRIKKGKPM